MTPDWDQFFERIAHPERFRRGVRRKPTHWVDQAVDDGLLVPLERLRQQPWYRRELERAAFLEWEADVLCRFQEALAHLTLGLEPVMRLDEYPCAKWPNCAEEYWRLTVERKRNEANGT